MNPKASEAGGLIAGYAAPRCTLRGAAQSAYFGPADSTLWQIVSELPAGAELLWTDAHGDEAIYVQEGVLDVDGRRAEAAGAVIVEAGVPAVVRVESAARLVHFGSKVLDPPTNGLRPLAATEGRGVHVVNVAEADLIETGFLRAYYYADGTCETCRMSLFVLNGIAGGPGPSHSHSEDEIIHILDGEMQIAGFDLPAGTSVAIPGDFRYIIRKPTDFSYINYRSDLATTASGTSAEPKVVIETYEYLLRASAAHQAATEAPSAH